LEKYLNPIFPRPRLKGGKIVETYSPKGNLEGKKKRLKQISDVFIMMSGCGGI